MEGLGVTASSIAGGCFLHGHACGRKLQFAPELRRRTQGVAKRLCHLERKTELVVVQIVSELEFGRQRFLGRKTFRKVEPARSKMPERCGSRLGQFCTIRLNGGRSGLAAFGRETLRLG